MTMRDWKAHWDSFPRSADATDYLRQVGKTVGGEAISREQLAAMLEDIVARLQLGGQDHVLDLCCGNGLLTAGMARVGGSVVGVDWSAPLIDVAVRAHSAANIRYVRKSILDLTPEDVGGVELSKVVMYEALQHFTRRQLVALLGVLKAVAPGARVLLGSVPDRGRKWRFYDTVGRRLDYVRRKLLGQDAIGTWWSRRQLSSIADDAGYGTSFHEQHPSLHTAHYRMDVVLRPYGGGL